MKPLANKIALVAGAGRGIGRATSLRLAEAGASLRLVARTGSELAALQSELPGTGHDFLAADLSAESGCKRLLEWLEEAGPAHVVVYNFYVRGDHRRLSKLAAADLACAVERNARPLLALLPACLPAQRAAGFGRWITISSAVARTGGPGQGEYVAVKAALEGLMRTLAVEEAGTGITANIVAPGFIDTPATRRHYSDRLRQHLGRSNLAGRAGQAAEVAHAVAYLAAPDAGFVSGETLAVDGGLSRGWFINDARDAERQD